MANNPKTKVRDRVHSVVIASPCRELRDSEEDPDFDVQVISTMSPKLKEKFSTPHPESEPPVERYVPKQPRLMHHKFWGRLPCCAASEEFDDEMIPEVDEIADGTQIPGIDSAHDLGSAKYETHPTFESTNLQREHKPKSRTSYKPNSN